MPESVVDDWVSWLFLIVSIPVCGICSDAGSKELDRFLRAIYLSGCSSGKGDEHLRCLHVLRSAISPRPWQAGSRIFSERNSQDGFDFSPMLFPVSFKKFTFDFLTSEHERRRKYHWRGPSVDSTFLIMTFARHLWFLSYCNVTPNKRWLVLGCFTDLAISPHFKSLAQDGTRLPYHSQRGTVSPGHRITKTDHFNHITLGFCPAH